MLRRSSRSIRTACGAELMKSLEANQGEKVKETPFLRSTLKFKQFEFGRYRSDACAAGVCRLT